MQPSSILFIISVVVFVVVDTLISPIRLRKHPAAFAGGGIQESLRIFSGKLTLPHPHFAVGRDFAENSSEFRDGAFVVPVQLLNVHHKFLIFKPPFI
jgi:hypothetical protein